MAVTAYTGPPGSGKSYAMVSEVIVPGLVKGRRVISNVSGLDAAEISAYIAKKYPKAVPGELVLFHGDDAKDPAFFPYEGSDPAQATVQAGDLIVFDEWKLTFSDTTKLSNPNVEKFMRYHRHLVGPDGRACDMVIGTQMIGDIQRSIRGLVERSFKFRNLKVAGLKGAFSYHIYEGESQAKGDPKIERNGRYKKEIFPLYKSYETDDDAKEETVDKRASLFGGAFMYVAVAAVLGIGFGIYGVNKFFSPDRERRETTPGYVPAVATGASPQSVEQPVRHSSRFRIVGVVHAAGRPRVVVTDGESVVLAHGRDFEFENGRPTSGMYQGERVIAQDRIEVAAKSDLEF